MNMQKVVLNIPHSGTSIPQWAAEDMVVSDSELDLLVAFMTDKAVDKMWGFVPDKNKQVAQISRLIVDTERYRNDEDEIMAQKGMGLYYTHTPAGKQFRAWNEASYVKCLTIYDSYHRSLEKKVTECLREHGGCLLLDCHSFHDEMRYTGYDTSAFPDVCIGVNGAVTEEARYVMDAFRSGGYTVKLNEPFSGALIPLKYLNDSRVDSIMIELNRRIYDNASFSAVQNLCRKIYDHLCNERGDR